MDFKNIHFSIADLCLKRFEGLPKTGKPKESEWTVLSCIVSEKDNLLDVVALGTGSKCIGKNKMSLNGDIINDSHAEIMCRRSFLRFLYEELDQVQNGCSSVFEFDTTICKFKLLESIKFHFFTTHVPCGDATIFPKQNVEDFGTIVLNNSSNNTQNSSISSDEIPLKKIKLGRENEDIFRTGAKCLKNDEKQDLHLDGSEYHVLGAVRTKPGRGDPTQSVSCSDKMSKWCHLGIQGALLSMLLSAPIYLSSFTIVSGTPFDQNALERALYGRLDNVSLKKPYHPHKMVIGQCSSEFQFLKTETKQPCCTSISWFKSRLSWTLEVAVEGKKQGVTKKNLNNKVGRLKISKIELFRNFFGVLDKYNFKSSINNKTTYRNAKMQAVDYQNCWNKLRLYLKVWSEKDDNLLNFCID